MRFPVESHVTMSSNSLPVVVVREWLTNSRSALPPFELGFCASSVPVPPVAAFAPEDHTTTGALVVSVTAVPQIGSRHDPGAARTYIQQLGRGHRRRSSGPHAIRPRKGIGVSGGAHGLIRDRITYPVLCRAPRIDCIALVVDGAEPDCHRREKSVEAGAIPVCNAAAGCEALNPIARGGCGTGQTAGRGRVSHEGFFGIVENRFGSG